MGLLDRLIGERRQSPRDLLEDDAWSPLGQFGGATHSGIQVSAEKSFQASIVRACAQVLAEDISTIPLPIMRMLPSGDRESLRDHVMWGLLNKSPNNLMTAMTWRELIVIDILLWGNHYSLLERTGGGDIGSFTRISPWDMNVRMIEGELWYAVRLANGTIAEAIPAEMMLHIPGLGFNGIKGLSVIGHARHAIGLTLAAEEYGARWFGQGTKPTGIFVHPGKLSPAARSNLITSLKEAYSGVKKSHGVIVTEGGTKYETIGIPPNDAQFIETRRFQTEDIARIFKVPGHMVGIRDNQPRANVEQESIGYVTHTVRPWCVRIEQSINRVAFVTTSDRSTFAEHNVDGLLRGDLLSRYKAFKIGRDGGWLSANEVRRRENMNSIEGGDVYLAPLNMVPSDLFEEIALQDDALASTVRMTFRDASLRVLRKERKAVTLKAKQLEGDALEAWRVRFYDDHRGAVASAFSPVLDGIVNTLAQRMQADHAQAERAHEIELGRLMWLRDSGSDPTDERMDAELRKIINNLTTTLSGFLGMDTATHRGWVVQRIGDRYGQGRENGAIAALEADAEVSSALAS